MTKKLCSSYYDSYVWLGNRTIFDYNGNQPNSGATGNFYICCPGRSILVTPAYRIWRPLRPLDLPEVGLRVKTDSGSRSWNSVPRRKKIPDLEIRWDVRRGVRPALGARTRSLRNLFQENGIPPWERRRIPIVCIAEEHCGMPTRYRDRSGVCRRSQRNGS